MTFEFDHLFICTDVGAKSADCLVSLGFVEGSSNQHPGQGTANRRFFFHNAMVEFLWVHDPTEAQSEAVRRTRLWERWREHTSVSRRQRNRVCPFGICLRPGNGSNGAIAFPSWKYRPPYLPAPLSIAVGNNSEELTEPMLFQILFGKRPDQAPPEKAQPLEHPLGLREITRVEVVTPIATCPSPELQRYSILGRSSSGLAKTIASNLGLMEKRKSSTSIFDLNCR